MTTLHAEKRDMSCKAKALRRQGKITGNLYGREMDETIAIQLEEIEAERFLRNNAKGSQVVLQIGDKDVKAMLKEVVYQPMAHQYENVDFQALVEGEKVVGTAQIVLKNVDKVVGSLEHSLTEVTYRAVPSALVEKVEIDVSKFKGETIMHVKDLDMAKNKDVDLITPADTLIFHISENYATADEDVAESSEE